MSTDTDYKKELEAQEKKHHKIMKYDFEAFVVLFVILVLVVIVNLMLKNDYKPLVKARSEIAPAMMECNKTILNIAETFRKNTTDTIARANVDAAKLSLDEAIGYYGRVVNKNTSDGVIIQVVDTCYLAMVKFHDLIDSQKELADAGISTFMQSGMDKDLQQLKKTIDAFVSSVETYNTAGFFLKLSWVTPYPGQIEYRHAALPEVQSLAGTNQNVQ